MSDPFEAFESANGTNGNGGAATEDPAAAFLAREELEFAKVVNNDFSNDAFGSFGEGSAPETNNQDGGSDPFAEPSAQTGGDNNSSSLIDESSSDLLSVGGSGDQGASETPAEPEPVVEQASAVEQPPAKSDQYSAILSADKFQQEPEKIKKWREEQKARLAQKDTEEEQKKKELKENAKKELEDWYKNRAEQLAKTHANNKVTNKAAEAELVASRDSQTAGQEWDRMAKLCDFNPKANKNTKDVSRMRSILLQLKQQPLVRQTN